MISSRNLLNWRPMFHENEESHERGFARRAKDSRNVFRKEAKRCMHTHEVGIRYLTAFSASGKALTVAWGAPR